MLILVTTVGIFTFTDYQQFRACKADLTDVYVDTLFAVARDFAD